MQLEPTKMSVLFTFRAHVLLVCYRILYLPDAQVQVPVGNQSFLILSLAGNAAFCGRTETIPEHPMHTLLFFFCLQPMRNPRS